MQPTLRCAAGLALLCAALAALAQAQAPAVAPAASAASAPARLTAAPQRAVIEDDAIRIEETRGRGQMQRISVQSKLPGVKGYEIIVAPGGKDSSQDRGAAGKRAWSLFDF
jgi:hypothetical protein